MPSPKLHAPGDNTPDPAAALAREVAEDLLGLSAESEAPLERLDVKAMAAGLLPHLRPLLAERDRHRTALEGVESKCKQYANAEQLCVAEQRAVNQWIWRQVATALAAARSGKEGGCDER